MLPVAFELRALGLSSWLADSKSKEPRLIRGLITDVQNGSVDRAISAARGKRIV